MEHDVASDDRLADGCMIAVNAGDRSLLLARVNGICHAVDNICPHAGGKLSEGVLHGDVVVCPWHKAAFSVVTGKHLQPPAVDDLTCFPVRVAGGRVLVTTGDEAGLSRPAMPGPAENAECFAIVGAGAAGAVAAQTLRAEGFAGRVVLISHEDQLPYDRTVLSKYALSGKQGGEKSPLQDAGFYDRHRIERLVLKVSAIDPPSRRIMFDDGTEISYNAALVATGGMPRTLQATGVTLPGVFMLRSAADAMAIADAAARASSAVIAGAGFIAMEAAASLCERGLKVTVVAPQSAPFERQLGARIGEVFRRVHEREGIAFRLDNEITTIEGGTHVERVVLRDGEALQADLVISGLGISPATAMLPAGLRRDDGCVPVDSGLRIADNLYAAGDIAAFPLRGDGERIRVEHWRVAQQHGRIAALNMLGGAIAFDAVPYFWTIHFLKRLDYVGHAETWDDIVVDGDLDEPEFLAFYLRDGKVAAVAGWGRDRQMAAVITLMTSRRDWSLPELREELTK